MSSMAESLSDSMAKSLSLSNHPSEITQFSHDLLSRILSQLPVKTLARSRSVCKSWNSLISSPEFISQHIYSTRFQSHSLLVLSKLNIYPIDEDPLYDLYSPPFDMESGRRRLETPPNPAGYGTLPVGIVHGVVCVFRTVVVPPERNVILWNPVTGKHVSIPIAQDSRVEGFGYDPVTKQLKVIATRRNGESCEAELEVEVVSHRDRQWRKLNGVSCDHLGVDKGAPVYEHQYYEGFIHWLRYGKCKKEDKEEGWFLVAFDCAKEEFGTMDLPEQLVKCLPPKKHEWEQRDNESSDSDKLIFTQCVALFSVQHFERQSYGYDINIWVMHEYGEPSSWMKMFTITLMSEFGNVRMLWEDGEVLLWLIDVKSLAAYDFTGSVLRRRGGHPNLVFDAHVFKESLLLMDA